MPSASGQPQSPLGQGSERMRQGTVGRVSLSSWEERARVVASCPPQEAVTSLSGSSLHLALVAHGNSSLYRGECSSHPSPLCCSLAVGRDVRLGVLWNGQLGRGDSAGSCIVTQVLAEPWTVPCSPFALLSCGLAVGDSFLQQSRAQSCFLHRQTLDVKTLLEFMWVTLCCSRCLALNQHCSVWNLVAALLSQ